MFVRRALLPLAMLLAVPATAAASSSAWQESEGGAIRLVTTGAPAADGTLQGALEIRLNPGWKTYWRDPGQTGVPPSLDASRTTGIDSAELSFPPPTRIDDGYGESAGYPGSVTLPVTFRLTRPAAPPLIEADVFLGLCRTICIPMQAALTVDAAADPADAGDAATVARARAALPEEPSGDFGVTGAWLEGDSLTIEAAIPEDGEEASLFVASAADYLFGLPDEKGRTGRTLRFSARVFDRPEAPSSAISFDYTLVAGSRAVSGKLQLR